MNLLFDGFTFSLLLVLRNSQNIHAYFWISKKHLMRLSFITNIWIWHPSCLPNDWFKSYQSNHNQKCFVKGHLSDNYALSCGIPQGTIPGPFLFLLYIHWRPLKLSFPLSASYVCSWHSDTSLGHIIINCNNAHFFLTFSWHFFSK